MCSPVRVETVKDYPKKLATPPPPSKTADTLITAGMEDERDDAERKRRGTRSLRIYDDSVLMIPGSRDYSAEEFRTLNIPR